MIVLIVELDTAKPIQINWGARGTERIIQNAFNLLNTWRNEVAYDRTMGIDTSVLDKPLEAAASIYISEAYRVLETHEPRVIVQEVKFSSVDNEGNMHFKVVIEV